jgi:hypothetical protein
MKDGYLIFIENKSWLLIQIGTNSIIEKKIIITSCKIWLQRLIGSVFFGRHRGGYIDKQPTRITLGCSMVSSHKSGVLFVLFGVEIRH